MLDVEVGKEVDISNRTEQLALQVGVVQLGNIAIDDDIRIQIQHLVVERQ